MPVALTIAGSDSSGGAGLQADLKTFSVFYVHGVCAVTGITVQNTSKIEKVYDLSPSLIKKQIVALAEDLEINSAKTGMLRNSKIIKEVARTLSGYDFPVVVDPVILSKSGYELLKEDAIEDFINFIFPISYLITPNRYEAEKLSNIKIKGKKDVEKALKILKKEGANSILIKGGHFPNKTDYLYHEGKIFEYKGKNIKGCTHGTGCSFSAAITANLAKGIELRESIRIAKNFIESAIMYGEKIGKRCPVNQISWLGKDAERWRVYEELNFYLNELLKENIYDLIPEVGTNFAYALPKNFLKDKNDILAIEGRIIKAGKSLRVGEIKFGTSRHLASAIMKAMEYDESKRCAINFKYDENLIRKAEKFYRVAGYDRRKEPENIKKEEGKSISWGTEVAIKKAGEVPDIIFHKGDVGKEAMITILGKNPKEIIEKIRKIIY
ncbi:MAG: bifunctional hydroxymethylpyrimidine kinase/phosphomethylpyrimidine kinase [Thermoplasmatales archaeon]|nr:bifunctional hydroxymethylpyrimidine kinase/phosphomethylpyrimidine kinase [Thermoplasmatales archaeon]